MQPLLFNILFKKDKKTKWFEYINLLKNKSFCLSIYFATLMGTMSSPAQRTALKYNVVQNDNVIGWLKIDKNDSANTSLIHFSSEIKKRVLFLFTIIENQEVLFENGTMTHSYVYRRINNDIKVNKHTTYTGDHYIVKNEKNSTHLMLNNIACNQLSLYFYEPVTVNQIYSDNYERYLKIEKTGNRYYTMKLPDGNKNTYYYSNGTCTKVKVEQSLFTVEFVLIK